MMSSREKKGKRGLITHIALRAVLAGPYGRPLSFVAPCPFGPCSSVRCGAGVARGGKTKLRSRCRGSNAKGPPGAEGDEHMSFSNHLAPALFVFSGLAVLHVLANSRLPALEMAIGPKLPAGVRAILSVPDCVVPPWEFVPRPRPLTGHHRLVAHDEVTAPRPADRETTREKTIRTSGRGETFPDELINVRGSCGFPYGGHVALASPAQLFVGVSSQPRTGWPTGTTRRGRTQWWSSTPTPRRPRSGSGRSKWTTTLKGA